jgi:hypothetical protein
LARASNPRTSIGDRPARDCAREDVDLAIRHGDVNGPGLAVVRLAALRTPSAPQAIRPGYKVNSAVRARFDNFRKHNLSERQEDTCTAGVGFIVPIKATASKGEKSRSTAKPIPVAAMRIAAASKRRRLE